MSAGKGSADSRTPNRQAREAGWERIWGKAPEARIGDMRQRSCLDMGYGETRNQQPTTHNQHPPELTDPPDGVGQTHAH